MVMKVYLFTVKFWKIDKRLKKIILNFTILLLLEILCMSFFFPYWRKGFFPCSKILWQYEEELLFKDALLFNPDGENFHLKNMK